MAKDIGADSTEAFADIRMTSDNGFILGIMSYSGISGYKTEASKGDRDYWIVKLNESGKFEWDKTLGGDSLDQTQSIVQAKDGGYVTVGWSQSNMSGDKTVKVEGKIFGLLNSNCALKISASIPQFVRVIPYNFLHQVELIIRGLDQLVLSPMNKTHLF
jgi:hypothetical protein